MPRPPASVLVRRAIRHVVLLVPPLTTVGSYRVLPENGRAAQPSGPHDALLDEVGKGREPRVVIEPNHRDHRLGNGGIGDDRKIAIGLRARGVVERRTMRGVTEYLDLRKRRSLE